MAIDGTWNTSANTPLGPMKGKLVLTAKDNTLSGSSTSQFGTDSFTGGKIDGDKFEFSVDSKVPMGRMKLVYKGKLDGDIITGETTTMGIRCAFKGERAAT
jgi:hypothetical protein